MKAKTKISLYLKPEQLDGLRAESERTGAPVAELIRRAIDAYLKTIKKGGRS
jgi:hypothetical protein